MSDTRFSKTTYQRANEASRVERKVDDQQWTREKQALAAAALQRQAKELVASGVSLGQLPNIHGSMSHADIANAQARLNILGGASPTDARTPGARVPVLDRIQLPSSPAVGRLTKTPLPAPAGAPMRTFDDIGRAHVPASIQASTPAQLLAFKKNDAVSVSDAATKAAAGTGQVVQTPYGTASSRMVKAGTPENAAVVTDTGVQREPRDWQRELVAKYPAIGVAGSPENKAFVERYKAMESKGGDFNPAVHGPSIAMELFPSKAPEDTIPGYTQSTAIPKVDPNAPTSTAPQGTLAGYTQSTSPLRETGVEAQGAALTAPIGKAIAATGVTTPGAFASEYLQPFKDFGGYVAGMAKGVAGVQPTPGAVTSTPPTPSLLPSSFHEFWNSATGQPVKDPAQPVKPALPYDGSNIAKPSNTPNAPVPPTSASAGATAPPLSMNGALPKFNGWQPDEDSTAFMQNPEEDQFRKRMREPYQNSYANMA
jgi:hypothetical protein